MEEVLICVSLEGDRLDELKIPMMVQENTSRFETAFTVSVEAREGTTTGISAAMIDLPQSSNWWIRKQLPQDFVKPGHMFPIRAREGGVLVRCGQTEASVDCANLQGYFPSGVICEIMNEDGTMARMPQLLKFSKEHSIKIISVADLIRYRTANEKFIKKSASAQLPTQYGMFQDHCL